jgi:hypothetical protein
MDEGEGMSETTPTPAPPSDLQAEFTRVQQAPFGVGESQESRFERLQALGRQLHPEPGSAPAPTEPAAPPVPLDDPATLALPAMDPKSGLTLDRPFVAQMYGTAEREGLARHDVAAGLAVLAECSYDPKFWTPKELAEFMTAKYGRAKWEDMNVFAGEAFEVYGGERMRAELTKKGQIKPKFVEYLAGIGEKLRDGGTPQGQRRLRRIYSAP